MKGQVEYYGNHFDKRRSESARGNVYILREGFVNLAMPLKTSEGPAYK